MVRVLNKELQEFIHQGLSITAASRDPRLIPSISKALACRVSADFATVHLFVNQVQAGQLLADIASSQRIAATYCLPSSHKTIQIKGRQAKQTELRTGDLEYTLQYVQRLTKDLESMGYDPDIIGRYLHVDPEQLVAISFLPEAIFEQSPGENAGEPMELS